MAGNISADLTNYTSRLQTKINAVDGTTSIEDIISLVRSGELISGVDNTPIETELQLRLDAVGAATTATEFIELAAALGKVSNKNQSDLQNIISQLSLVAKTTDLDDVAKTTELAPLATSSQLTQTEVDIINAINQASAGGTDGIPVNGTATFHPNTPDNYTATDGSEYLKTGFAFVDYLNEYPDAFKVFPVVGDTDDTSFVTVDQLYALCWSEYNGGTWWTLERSGAGDITFREYGTDFVATGNSFTPNIDPNFSGTEIAVDSAGFVYVWDNTANVLQRFSQTGVRTYSTSVTPNYGRGLYFDNIADRLIAITSSSATSVNVREYDKSSGSLVGTSSSFTVTNVVGSLTNYNNARIGDLYFTTATELYVFTGINITSMSLIDTKPVLGDGLAPIASKYLSTNNLQCVSSTGPTIFDLMDGVGTSDTIQDSNTLDLYVRIK